MIVLKRRDAARFRAALRRCVAGRLRGAAPSVVLVQSRDALTLSAVTGETSLSLRLPTVVSAPTRSARLHVPATLLERIDGAGETAVTLEESSPGRIRCSWQEEGGPKELEAESAVADPRTLPSPKSWQEADRSLLEALHTCGKSTARNDSRYGLTRLQLRGGDGQVIGTDGCQLLRWGPFDFGFPFSENLLIPAVPVFGGRELALENDVKIGRTSKHVVIAAGPWTVWLGIDTTARFPDVATVIPRSTRLARMTIDEEDMAVVQRALEAAQKLDDDTIPITLEFGPRARIGVPGGTPSTTTDVELTHSVCAGPKTTATIDRRYLMRALSLGLREIRVAPSQEAIHFRDERRSYLVARLDPSKASTRPEPDEQPSLSSANGEGATRNPLRPVTSNGDDVMKSDKNGFSAPEQAPVDEAVDLLAEAEALRAALTDAVRRVGRLLLGLRQYQRQRRALQVAWTSLKQLRLSPKEEP